MSDETKKVDKIEKVSKIMKCPKCDVKLVDCKYQKDALECKTFGRLYTK